MERSGGGLRVTNGLGADLVELWLADDSGALHHTEAIASGAEAVLTLTARSVAAMPGSLRDTVYGGDLPTRLAELRRAPESILRPGSYLAVTAARCPLWNLASRGPAERGETGVVFGWLEDGWSETRP